MNSADLKKLYVDLPHYHCPWCGAIVRHWDLRRIYYCTEYPETHNVPSDYNGLAYITAKGLDWKSGHRLGCTHKDWLPTGERATP